MELRGSIAQNLRAAIESSRRLKGHPIHRDTLKFWSELIAETRTRRASGELLDDPEVDEALAELELVLAGVSGS
jgi:hypothetical protein